MPSSAFLSEDLEGSMSLEDWGASFQLLELPSSDILEELRSNFFGKIFDDKSESPPSPSNYDEKTKLTGLANSAQTASSGNSYLHRASYKSKTNPFCFSGSVSVLESSGLCSLENSTWFGTIFFIPVKRAQSKRLRPGALNHRLSVPLVSTSRVASNTASPACSTSHFETKTARLGQMKGKEMDPSHSQAKIECYLTSDPSMVRKCTHCKVTSTPQWREGPLGLRRLATHAEYVTGPVGSSPSTVLQLDQHSLQPCTLTVTKR